VRRFRPYFQGGADGCWQRVDAVAEGGGAAGVASVRLGAAPGERGFRDAPSAWERRVGAVAEGGGVAGVASVRLGAAPGERGFRDAPSAWEQRADGSHPAADGCRP
jgi:hypothetical protein